MIKRGNYRVLNEEEKSKYNFKFCECCHFYACELIAEYMLFEKNNPSITWRMAVL